MDKELKYWRILGFVLEYLQRYIKNRADITNCLKIENQHLFLEIQIVCLRYLEQY